MKVSAARALLKQHRFLFAAFAEKKYGSFCSHLLAITNLKKKCFRFEKVRVQINLLSDQVQKHFKHLNSSAW
jgi:hypothetical protein